MVLVTKENKRKVYLHLLQEGVFVVKKDFSTTPHEEVNVPNLHVWMLLRSLKDRDLVELVFNWQYYYYYINENGVNYLREALGIAEQSIAPKTFKKEVANYTGKDETEEQEDRRQRKGQGRFGSGQGRTGRGAGRGQAKPEETPAAEEQTAQE